MSTVAIPYRVKELQNMIDKVPGSDYIVPDPYDISSYFNPIVGTTIKKGSMPLLRKLVSIFNKDAGAPLIQEIRNSPKYFAEAKGITAKRELLTPDEYMKRAFIEDDKARKVARPDSVREYALAMENLINKKTGVKFDTPWIIESKSTTYPLQEGRHRTMAAESLGLEKVPTWIVKKAE